MTHTQKGTEKKMKRRDFLKVAAGAAMATTIPRASSDVVQHNLSKLPNVLLIITDDQGWGDIHSHGNEKLDTPVLDQLAADGARFDRFFVSPLCAPTRASLLTGRYHLRTGTHGVTRGQETMRSEEVTIAEIFKDAGYATGCFGKWHNGAHYPHHPNGQGFDEFLGFCAGHWNNYFDTTLEDNGKPVKTKGYISDVLTDAVLSFMERHRNHPFFCYVPYNAPHSPWQVPDKYFDKYKVRGFDDVTACAYGMVENLDENIGRLLRKLGELDLTENTIVLFLTDNGPNSDRYNGDMKGRKGSADEGGVRVPLFIRWPGHIQPGMQIRQIAAHIDLVPTLVELSGVSMPKTLPLDGISLAPLLRGEIGDWPDRTLFTHRGNRGSARTQRWRAVRNPRGWELFDMSADSGQTRDAAKEHPGVIEKLAASYEASLEDVLKAGLDIIPIPIGHPQRREVILPGHEAFLHPAAKQGISYCGEAGWANDWIANWTSTDAYPYWELDVVRSGLYEISLMYVCPREDVGSRIRVEVGSQSLEGVVRLPHDPQPLPSPDRVPRKEVHEKVWATLTVGKLELGNARTRLCVKAIAKPGKAVMDLKAVHVRRID